MYYQPIPDPSAAHNLEDLHQLPQPDLYMPPPIEPVPVEPMQVDLMQPDLLCVAPQQVDALLEAPQADGAYLDPWTGAPMGADDLVVDEFPDTPSGVIQEALLTSEVPTITPDLSLVSEGPRLPGFRDIESELQAPKEEFELREGFRPVFSDSPYSEVVDSNAPKGSPAQHVDPYVPGFSQPYEDKGWGRNLGGPVEHHEPGNEESGRPYNTPLPKISRSRGRGFNPNTKRGFWSGSLLLKGERRDKACPSCGCKRSYYGKCRDCGRLFWCTWCEADTDSQGRCQNPDCMYFGEARVHERHIVCHACGETGVRGNRCLQGGCGIYVFCPGCGDRTDRNGVCRTYSCPNAGHRPDDPTCGECHKFVDDGEALCEECKKKWPYAPLQDWSESIG